LQFKGQTVLIGVDDMDLFKGIELKLLALERVLDYHPEWRGRLTLVQVTNAPRCAHPDWEMMGGAWKQDSWESALADVRTERALCNARQQISCKSYR
jgi:hypothetical protein